MSHSGSAISAAPGEQRVSGAATVLLETAALDRGLSTTRLRPQTFLAEDPTGGTIAFHEGRSTTSTHAGIHFCESRIHRYDRLRAAGVPVPRALIVDAEARADAERFAAGVPGDVLLKSSQRSRNSSSATAVREPQPFEKQWDRLTRRLRPGARFLVEEFVAGPEYAFDVVAGRVVAVRPLMRRSAGVEETALVTSSVLGVQKVSESFHPDVLELVRRIAHTVPPLVSMTLRMVCPRPTETADECCVLSLEPQVDLTAEDGDPSWGAYLAGQIMDAELDRRPVRREPTGGRLRVNVEFSEVGDTAALIDALQPELSGLLIDGSLEDPGFREVRGTLEGRPSDLALMQSKIIGGLMVDEIPEMARVVPCL
ncbi:hypothetical protein [Nesterenkonia aerolata]|uniref:ATP-grasp domain-containing protein n=1 Tax=Nesterenkonia aerolata TaxID=3074079 RepID=A0ABU2DQZ1_9MICC|nr:hypothetical protein [Nesterenkonia sp. LY-0111]MDR8018919.1 hypothetical protein [Nesterenkonia sp. LY-0111]